MESKRKELYFDISKNSFIIYHLSFSGFPSIIIQSYYPRNNIKKKKLCKGRNKEDQTTA